MEIKLVCSKPPHHPWSVNTSRSFHFFSIKSMTQQIGPDREYLITHLGIETSKVGKTFKNQGVFMSFGIEKKRWETMGKMTCISRQYTCQTPKMVRMMELLVASFTFHVENACSVSIPDESNASFTWRTTSPGDLELNKNAAYSHWEVNVSNDCIVMIF